MSSDSASSNNGSRSPSRQVTIQRFVVVGYIVALAIPPVGFAIGLVLMLSPGLRSRQGIWIVLASIVAAALWALIISSGALTATNQGY